MRRTLGIVLGVIVAALVTTSWRGTGAASPTSQKADNPEHRSDFVVHEWGTFTNFSGSDGVQLEFRPLVDHDLPEFVVDRAMQAGSSNPWSKARIRVLQRMETPVTYFYTDREREVSVRVRFPQGLLTEFFPPVQAMQPAFQWNQPEPVSNSVLDWGRVWLIPTDHVRTHIPESELAKRIDRVVHNRLLERVSGDNHYADARDTDSAIVHVSRPPDPKRPLAPVGQFFEKFLFYRGVGNFRLPLTLKASGDSVFELTNTGADEIRQLFLVNMQGKQLRFAHYDRIVPGEHLTLRQPTTAASLEQLGAAVVKSLVAERLYEKEAQAMVKTWQSSWFGEEGTRLFYVLPGRMTDELLPLELEPRPDETIRVMVGRMEIMTPETEQQIMELVRQSATDRAHLSAQAAIARKAAESSSNAQPTEPPRHVIPAAIVAMGRLAEPALVRVRHIAREASVRHEASVLLSELQAALVTADQKAVAMATASSGN